MRMVATSLVLGLIGLLSTPTLSGETAPSTILIGKGTQLRMHAGWKTPVWLSSDGKQVPATWGGRKKRPYGQFESEPPERNWMEPGFDDTCWSRVRPPLGVVSLLREGANNTWWNQICVRARFKVTDPAKVKDLKLTTTYIGGAVVYVNGKELGRANLPDGELTSASLAKKYPKEAYANSKNVMVVENMQKNEAETLGKRVRSFEKTIPADMLRAGVNLVAVDVRRAPYVRYPGLKAAKAGYRGSYGVWGHNRLLSLEVTASATDGLEPNVGRPKGIKVWTPHPLETLVQGSWADPNESPGIRIAAARNGYYSGRIMITSDKPISGLKVTPGNLVAEGGTKLPAAMIKVRNARPWQQSHSWVQRFNRRKTNPIRFDILEEEFPEKIEPVKGVANALVWLSLKTPKDAKPGTYRGKARVEAEGLEAVEVPIEVTVYDWMVPEPKDWVSHINLYQSHDSTALCYKHPLWSEEHFNKMRKSLELIRDVGNRFCTVHLICDAYCMGNAQSMVHWIKKDDGTWDHDFTVFDKYLDLFEKVQGKPHVLMLSVWVPWSDKVRSKQARGGAWVGEDGSPRTKVNFTIMDPKNKQFSKQQVPNYGTEKALAFWKPVLDKVRKRLEKRGWMDVAHLGTASDNMPCIETSRMFKKIWPDGRWIASTHMEPSRVGKGEDAMPVRCLEHVWGAGHLYDAFTKQNAYPRCGRSGKIVLAHARAGQGFIRCMYDSMPMSMWKFAMEGSLQGNLKGIGRVGADFYPIPGLGYNRLSGSKAGGSHLGPRASVLTFTSAGPDGPTTNERYEYFRESMQIREALIFVSNNRRNVGDELAARANKLLDQRARHYKKTRVGWKGLSFLWRIIEGSGWERRDHELLELAAEMSKTLGKPSSDPKPGKAAQVSEAR